MSDNSELKATNTLIKILKYEVLRNMEKAIDIKKSAH